jgi:predicted nuclease with TOPRIM domain
MTEQLKQRLYDLKVEFEKGQQRLQELDAEATSLRNTLMRISGAIQVLEEELAKAGMSKS